MIWITTRLSRGARYRRRAPIWFYAVLAAGGVAAVLIVVLQH
jgi:hypothetical protein